MSIALSDVAVLVIIAAAVRAARRFGIEPLRRGGWTLVGAAALIALVFVATLAGPILTDGYPLARSLVSAAKFAEYGALAVAVPLIVRRRADALAVAVALTAVASLAALVGILQIIGLIGNLDNVPAGRRMPSFVGYHDFAALAGATLGIAIAVIALGKWRRLRTLGAAAAGRGRRRRCHRGRNDHGPRAAPRRRSRARSSWLPRKTFSAARALAIGGLLLAITLGTLSLRSGDVADFVGLPRQAR